MLLLIADVDSRLNIKCDSSRAAGNLNNFPRNSRKFRRRGGIIFHSGTTNGGVYRRFMHTRRCRFDFCTHHRRILVWLHAARGDPYAVRNADTPAEFPPRNSATCLSIAWQRGPRLDNARLHRYRASIIG